MKKNIFLILILQFSMFPCFSETNKEKLIPVKKQSTIYDYKDTVYTFDGCSFTVRLFNNFKSLNIKYQSKSYYKEFSLDCNSYVELLSLIQLDENIFWFSCESLGFEQFFIYNLVSDKIYEPFFDMKNQVYINKIDYKNQILFGDTWNSDKGIMPDQKIELYLFSTVRQCHYKIAEKYGETFNIALLDNNRIEYNGKNGELIQFDYSDWIIKDISYAASSFLIEGKTIYEGNNLSSKEGLPWASANGYGINDKIIIKAPTYPNMKIDFYNGFQSISRPDLYNANSRAKKIRVKNLETGNYAEYLLKDSPDVQEINLEELHLENSVYSSLEITILEIYPGEKYKDLCIQAIIPVY